MVCAVLAEHDRELQSAVAAQERPADLVARFSDTPSAAADWLWILDGTALPCPGALAALLSVARRLDSIVSPVLLTTRIVGSDGCLAAAHVPVAPQNQTAMAVRTARMRVLPIRAATGGSLLVRREGLAALPRPGMGPTLAWTAQHLREGGGFLVPSSLALARPVAHPWLEQAAMAAGLILGPGLNAKERLRFATEVCERALAPEAR